MQKTNIISFYVYFHFYQLKKKKKNAKQKLNEIVLHGNIFITTQQQQGVALCQCTQRHVLLSFM